MEQVSVHDLFDLSGKKALVTGGARNLGFDMALALSEAGASVVVTSRSLESARDAAKRITETTGCDAAGVECDVRFEDQVVAAVDAAIATLGCVDILINNAGNVLSTRENKPIEDRPADEWDFTVDTNMKGVFLCSKQVVARSMKKARRGVIINIASVAGLVGKDHRVYRDTDQSGVTIDYAASKAGVVNMTREMACWWAQYGIRVNCISPGGFWRGHSERFTRQYSELVPMGRMGVDGKEMKGPALFLASEASSYITGANLVVDGGVTAW